MKNQRMKANQSIRFSVLAVLLMAVLLIGCFAVTTFAANGNETVDIEADLVIGLDKGDDGLYTKEYDGKTDVDVKAANSAVVIKSAKLGGTDVGVQTLTVSLSKNGADATVNIAVRITPKKLAWESGKTAVASTVYRANTSVYENLTVTDLPKLMDGNTAVDLAIGELKASVNAGAAGTYETFVTVDLGKNYTVDPLPVTVTVAKVQIVSVEWIEAASGVFTFAYGDPAANNLAAIGKDAEGNEYPLVVVYPEGYGNVISGYHSVTAVSPDEENLDLGTLVPLASVIFTKETYTVSMEDLTVIGKGDLYTLTVKGEIPAEILSQITYTVGGNAFAGAAEYGVYEITATLPESANFAFADAEGNGVTSLTAKLTIQRQYVAASTEDGTFQIFISNTAGLPASLQASVKIPTDLSEEIMSAFKVYSAYTLEIVDGGDGTYSIIIPITEKLYGDRLSELTAEDIYFYVADAGKLVKVTEAEGCTVALKNGYYQIDGLKAAAARTIVIAPEYNTPFWLTAPGIALLIVLFLLLLIALFLAGLFLRRIRDRKNRAMTMDDEGDVPAVEPVEVEDKVDLDEELEKTLDQVEENLEDEVAAEEDAPVDATAETAEAVVESIDDLKAEAAECSLEDEDNTVAEDLADTVAEQVADAELPEEEAEADEEALRLAVAAAMADAANESADATDAVALVDEDDEDEAEEEEEDDGFAFGGFAGLDLKYIDAMAQPDEYAALLEQERNGEIRIVTRYRKSFGSRLAQSQGNAQEYYSLIKNALLAHKGVKCRTSWNYEAFNRGRTHVAKINVKTKTLYLYLALDPAELVNTKYGIVDVSSKKKYASVPVLMKIKGERKFKYALELVDMLCGEALGLTKLDLPEVDYKLPYQTMDEMVESGLVKMMVAGVPASYFEEAPAVEETAEEAPAKENADVTFVEPTDDPAVAAAAEQDDTAEV